MGNNNLTLELTSFVGRERQVAELRELLDSVRLVTLVGAGGVGKTRLALRVAREVISRFADGVWLIELATLRDPGLIAQAVAEMLGVPGWTASR